jgi:hypothetical protein
MGKTQDFYSIKVPTQGMTHLEGILDNIGIIFTTANNKWKITKY